MPKIAILGGGLAGLAAASVLGDQDAIVYEAMPKAGGHASSFAFSGFTFDEGPHVSFTSNERIRDFFARSVDFHFLEHRTDTENYYQGLKLRNPIQTNLHGLPTDIIRDCIADFVRAKYEHHHVVLNYRDWCYKQLGCSISERFTRLYTRKYWTRELEGLSTDWIDDRIHAPTLEEVLDGALGTINQHYYISSFRYPERGGFESYTRLLASRCRIEYGHRVVEIDSQSKKLVFADHRSEYFEKLISTVPLPELICMMKDAPPVIRQAAEKLACTSHFLVSLGINRPHLSDSCWTYYYDEDLSFSRLSFPYRYSPFAAPEGCSSVQAEIVHSRFRPLSSEQSVIEQCIDGLHKCGILHGSDEIIATDTRDIKYANVIFDLDRAANVAAVHAYLDAHGIEYCGRYGDWAYLWSDQSVLSGERAGNEVRRSFGLQQATINELRV